jgi:hypothetical protein
MKENEMGWACGTYGERRKEVCVGILIGKLQEKITQKT